MRQILANDFMSQSITQAARDFRISRRTIQRYIARGLLKKTPDGKIELAAIGKARAETKRRSKNRGRPLGGKGEERLFKLPKQTGFYRGRTQTQRVEIILREFAAVKNPQCLISLATYLAADLAPQLQQITKEARKVRGSLEKAVRDLKEICTGPAFRNQAASGLASSPAAFIAEMLADFEAKLRK